jgi:hypothetical protein|tara:strand:+ start:4358 stop:4771 length:414 start_codon:yes stop_codon:yes gene_type:complete
VVEEIKNIKFANSELSKFGITIGIILFIIAGIFLWIENDLYIVLLYISLILIITGVLFPFLLKPVYLIWMVFSYIISWFMTRIILSLLFYLIITPIGLISRLLGKQFLELRWNKLKGSYWNIRKKENYITDHYEKQF